MKTICEHPYGALCKASRERYPGEWTCIALCDTHFPNKKCPFYARDPKKCEEARRGTLDPEDNERIQNDRRPAWIDHIIGGMKK